MKLLEFTAALHDEIQKMVFPKCNSLEQLGVGLTLGMVDYKIGQLAAENADIAVKMGLVSSEGDVNLDCVEHMLKTGIQWPFKVGPFTFSADDAKSIMAAIKARGGK